jgi:hypothetical protein
MAPLERMNGRLVLGKHLEKCPVEPLNQGDIDAGAAGAIVTPDIDRPISKYIVRNLEKGSSDTKIRWFFWALAIVFGLLQAWASRFDLVNDTVCYLDIGDHIWHGQWSMAVNGVWNPLYAAILGVSLGLVKPSPYSEYPLVHLVLFCIFLLALYCFDFLLRELILLRRENESHEEVAVPAWIWLTIGYTIFLWSSLQLIGVRETNPDVLVASCFYFSCGLLIRIHRGVAGWPAYLGLGSALGFGYLTKSIMFPVSLVCLGVALASGRGGLHIRRTCAALCVFLVISAPFIVALSMQRGRFTFGDSGRYNYLAHVNQLPPVHWQGETSGSGRPLHASRQILDHPATFEFDGAFPATYPAWYDPSYWYEGVQTRFDLRREARVVAKNLMYETSLFFGLSGSLLAGLFVMFYTSSRRWLILKDIANYWFVLLPSLATYGMYALIYIEARYLAPFVVMVILSFVFSIHLPVSPESRRLWSALALLLFVMLFSLWGGISQDIAHGLRVIYPGRPRSDLSSPQEVADEMRRLGLRPGDRIASLEFSLIDAMIWARLARVSIIAEVYYWPQHPETFVNDFWKADSVSQEKVIQVLAETGARAIVSLKPQSVASQAGWQQAGNTQYYIYWLHARSPSLPSE